MTQTIYASNIYDSEKMRVSRNSAYVITYLLNKIYRQYRENKNYLWLTKKLF